MPMFSGGYAGPKEVHYLFIDGEQLRCTLDKVGREWFGQPIQIDYQKLQGANQKVFFYDCLPAERPNEIDGSYAMKREAKIAFFDELRAIPGWHVSEGLARHRKKERQEQKEVDILIAVDMLTHTHRRNMHRLTFLSGDQDFAPLLEAVVREGMYVELLYPEGHTARDLMHFADVARPLNVDFLYSNATETFQRNHGLPTRSYDYEASPINAVLVGEGLQSGQLFARVWKEESGTFNIKLSMESPQGQYLTVRHNDDNLAKRYFELNAGATEWRTPTAS